MSASRRHGERSEANRRSASDAVPGLARAALANWRLFGVRRGYERDGVHAIIGPNVGAAAAHA
jgi:hypothetical protein